MQQSGSTFVWAAVFLALSRIFQTMAFFMPLKVLIILSSDSGTRYQQYVEQWVSSEQFIWISVALVPVVYGLYIALGTLYRRAYDADKAAQIVRVNDLKCDRKYKRKLTKNHDRLVRLLSDVCIIIIVLVIVIIINIEFTIVLLVMLFLNMLVFNAQIYGLKGHARLTFLRLHPNQFVEYVTSTNYILFFVFLAISIYVGRIDVINAVLNLFLCRLALQAVQRFSIESRVLKNELPLD